MIRQDLDDLCTCGHLRRHHFGFDDGPCLAAHKSAATGKYLDGTVCACSSFRAPGGLPVVLEHQPVRVEVALEVREAVSEARAEKPIAFPSVDRPPKQRRRATEQPRPGGDCWIKSCGDPATVIVAKNGRPYCRPHGLAEALRLPRSEIHPIGDVLAA